MAIFARWSRLLTVIEVRIYFSFLEIRPGAYSGTIKTGDVVAYVAFLSAVYLLIGGEVMAKTFFDPMHFARETGGGFIISRMEIADE